MGCCCCLKYDYVNFAVGEKYLPKFYWNIYHSSLDKLHPYCVYTMSCRYCHYRNVCICNLHCIYNERIKILTKDIFD